MGYVVTAVVGYALLSLTYSFLRTQWPQSYYSVSDIVARAQSVSLKSYVLFRFAPALSVALLGSGLLRQQGKEGAAVWAAALSPVLAHAVLTHGRTLIKGRGSFGRRQQVVYHLLALVGLVLVAISGVWLGAQDFSRPLLPSVEGLADGIWTALLAGLLAAGAYRALQPRATDAHAVASEAYHALDPELVAFAREQANTLGADGDLVVGIMAVESIQRPRWVRRLERAFSRLLRRGTYGIMQVQSPRPLSDRESVHAAVSGPLAGIKLERTQYGEVGRDDLAAAVWVYNSDPAFLDWLAIMLWVVSDESGPSGQ